MHCGSIAVARREATGGLDSKTGASAVGFADRLERDGDWAGARGSSGLAILSKTPIGGHRLANDAHAG